MHQPLIRNFSIIAHIDHGKSTLADRIIERSQIIAPRDFKNQVLDSMDLERERGISIKSHAITIPYQEYTLNLIDTPGHADFSYEVSRAIASCEGALLLVDATQGVQAQTVSNLYLAIDYGLEIVPVVNKIDLPNADIESVTHQIGSVLGLDSLSALSISAKANRGIDELLLQIIARIPPPSGDPTQPLQARIFDSHYDPYRGVVAYMRVVHGTLKAGDEVVGWQHDAHFRVEEVGHFGIKPIPTPQLAAGEVGYMLANIKTVSEISVGDTITHARRKAARPLSGFRHVKPAVFSSFFPESSDQHLKLRQALEKLRLNDASFTFEPDSSLSLGLGFRCGFLGLLHLEIVQERIAREFNLAVIASAPSVRYEITLKDQQRIAISSPSQFPDPQSIAAIQEPYVAVTIITPHTSLGKIMQLSASKRASDTATRYLDEHKVELCCTMPLAEIVYDFYDELKSLSNGFASFDYEFDRYYDVDLVKIEILIGGERTDALSLLVHRSGAERRARSLCRLLREKIPRHQFLIPIQAAIGSRIIARENISAYRKDVTSGLYGGDITRKKKLLTQQKKGKSKMKQIGKVNLPHDIFISVLKSQKETH